MFFLQCFTWNIKNFEKNDVKFVQKLKNCNVKCAKIKK